MSGLEKIFIVGILLLAAVVVVILLMPDTSGQSGFQSLSPLIGKASEVLAQTLASMEHKLAAWTGSVQTWVRQATSSWGASRDQGNPVDSAVQPVGDYGEEQKDVLGKPIEGLQP